MRAGRHSSPVLLGPRRGGGSADDTIDIVTVSPADDGVAGDAHGGMIARAGG
ncbi:MAG: hypothetical protein NZ561_07315 [Phycisphaerae bacterium]|nr:hypothetical protein [Phycisphaerae bacterium]